MKPITIKALYNYLRFDFDFKKAYEKQTTKQEQESYEKSIVNFLGSLIFDNVISYYEMKKPYIDIAHLKLGETLINLDDLYIDYKAYLN